MRRLLIGGFELLLQNITDDISHDIAENKYPYQNGGDLEDVGANPESFHFQCIAKDASYEQYFELRKFFLSAFIEPVELEHPELGLMIGFPKNVSFGQDEKIGLVTVAFDFTIDELQPEQQSFIVVGQANEAEAVAINEEVASALAETMAITGVPDVEGDDWSLLDYWGKMGDAARDFANMVGNAVGQMMGYIEAVKAPIDAISSTIDYMDTLSGNLTKCIEEACESFVSLSRKVGSDSGKSSSKSVISALAVDISNLVLRLNAPESVKNALVTLGAATLALEASKQIAADEERMNESVSAEKVVSEDSEGNAMNESRNVYIVTPADFEVSLATVNQFIQDNLDRLVSPDRIKKMSANMAQAVLRIKLQSMTTVKITLQEPTPLHAILRDRGIPYQAADRVAALNGVKNPTFMNGEVILYA